MNENLPQLEAVFHEALNRAESVDRAAYLDSACAGNLELRRRVDELLAAHAERGNFLGGSAEPTMKYAGDPKPDTAEVGMVIANRYKLLEPIGEGGMGTVFMAEQTAPVRRLVALKIIKPGMDSKAVLARFEAERQALALMDHPNIAKVLDAGSTDRGLPFFVMELVKGTPITRFCDEQRLSPRERLELFVPVCLAIQHAHQKGVIHRDIKPSNVLVALYDGQPVPKVIDFGVAKAAGQPLTEKTLHTGFGALVGTPEYMSPEQATFNQLDIDTRSDVYSLGVLLYELLTGTTPVDKTRFKEAAVLEVLRVVREEEPPRPSVKLSTLEARASIAATRGSEPDKLSNLMRGEVDWIVMKALEKDRNRRYDSPAGLAKDVLRYLNDELVEARPPSTGYRFRKFVRAHRNGVITFLVFLTTNLIAWGAVVWQLVEKDFANQREKTARVEAETLAKRLDQQRADAEASRQTAVANAEQAMREKARADANAMRFGRDLYALQMKQAQQAWDEGRTARVRELFDSQRPENTVGVDLRGFEWNYLNRLCNSDIQTIETHGANSVAYSSDGRLMAWGGTNYTLQIWDIRKNERLFDLTQRHSSEVWCVVFSPDGNRLASATGEWGSPGTKESEIKVWDTATGEELHSIKTHPGSITNLAWSFDGTRLASAGSDLLVKIWDAKTGEEVLKLASGIPCNGVAFSPDGTRLACAYESGKERHLPGELKVWDLTTKTESLVLQPDHGRLFGVCYHPKGTQLAVAGDRGVTIWDAGNGKKLHSLTAGIGRMTFLSYNRAGTQLAAGFGRIAKVWDAATGQEVNSFRGQDGDVLSVAFSADDSRLVVADGWKIKIWDLNRSQEPLTRTTMFDTWLTCVTASNNGEYVATGGGGKSPLIVWDAKSGQEFWRHKASEKNIWCVAFSPDHHRIATAGEDMMIRVWDLATRAEALTLKGHTTQVNGIAFSPDGTRIASVSGNGQNREPPPEIKVWDAASGRELASWVGNSTKITSIAYSPDGQRLVGGITQYGIKDERGFQKEYISGEVQIWDAETGHPLMRLKDDHHVESVCFSSDGTRIAAGGLSYGAKVWNATTGELMCAMKGHTSDVNGVAFSPDCKRLATVSDDMSVRVWDTTTGQETLLFRGGFSQRIKDITFSPDGTRLYAVGGETLRIWDASAPTNVTIGVDGLRITP
jgi:WD40 repeat protein/serine/threonine protein kinase